MPLGLIYRLWTKSIRVRYTEEDGRLELSKLPEPMTFVLWHNRLFFAGEWHLRFRRPRRCYGLISGSRDGAWLETFYSWAGILAIRGSNNKRGFQAARELIQVVRDGHDIGVTPDGSRGPKYRAKAGALFVAKVTKSPVALLAFSYSRAIRLKSWDHFAIPFPFSKIHVKTKVISNDELFGNQGLKEATMMVENSLVKLTDDGV